MVWEFRLEEAGDELRAVFADVRLETFPGHLEVTEVEPVARVRPQHGQRRSGLKQIASRSRIDAQGFVPRDQGRRALLAAANIDIVVLEFEPWSL